MILTPGSTSCSKPFSLSRTRSSRLDDKGSAAGYKHGTAEILKMLGIIDSAEIHPDCPDLRPGDEQARMREALIALCAWRTAWEFLFTLSRHEC